MILIVSMTGKVPMEGSRGKTCVPAGPVSIEKLDRFVVANENDRVIGRMLALDTKTASAGKGGNTRRVRADDSDRQGPPCLHPLTD